MVRFPYLKIVALQTSLNFVNNTDYIHSKREEKSSDLKRIGCGELFHGVL